MILVGSLIEDGSRPFSMATQYNIIAVLIYIKIRIKLTRKVLKKEFLLAVSSNIRYRNTETHFMNTGAHAIFIYMLPDMLRV